jgi:DNA-directed RNA polymerase specialized sigma24 family protein
VTQSYPWWNCLRWQVSCRSATGRLSAAKRKTAYPSASPRLAVSRIAHNTALDFLRRRARQDASRSDEDPDMIVNPTTVAEDRQTAALSQHVHAPSSVTAASS